MIGMQEYLNKYYHVFWVTCDSGYRTSHHDVRCMIMQLLQRKLISFLLNCSVLWCCWLGGRKGIWPVKNCVVGCWIESYMGTRTCLHPNRPHTVSIPTPFPQGGLCSHPIFTGCLHHRPSPLFLSPFPSPSPCYKIKFKVFPNHTLAVTQSFLHWLTFNFTFVHFTQKIVSAGCHNVSMNLSALKIKNNMINTAVLQQQMSMFPHEFGPHARGVAVKSVPNTVE